MPPKLAKRAAGSTPPSTSTSPLSNDTKSALAEVSDKLEDIYAKFDAFDEKIDSKLETFHVDLKNFIAETLAKVVEENTILRQRVDQLEDQQRNFLQSPDFRRAVSDAVEDHLQREEKKMNLVLVGLAEPQPGLSDTPVLSDLQKVTDLAGKLSISPNSIKEVFRHGTPRGDKKPRIVKIVFSESDSRRRFLSNLRPYLITSLSTPENPNPKLPFYVRPDLTRFQLEVQRKLNTERWRRFQAGEDVVIFRDQVMLRVDRDRLRSQRIRPHMEN